ncbi:hypothetical protein BHM03_00029915 [Ensete ventricosum]|nr:hypothetical protein BHM03_00029915 [Ensete ventricosum]
MRRRKTAGEESFVGDGSRGEPGKCSEEGSLPVKNRSWATDHTGNRESAGISLFSLFFFSLFFLSQSTTNGRNRPLTAEIDGTAKYRTVHVSVSCRTGTYRRYRAVQIEMENLALNTIMS